MGVCINKTKKEKNPNNQENIEKKDYIPEAKIINSKIMHIPKEFLKTVKSLCKIMTEKKISSGFLIKLFRGDDDFFCLMTNEHVVTNDMIEQNQKIIFYYDNETKRREIYLNSKERIIKEFTDIKIDVTVIEIIPKDKISKKYFLLPNIDYMDNYKDYLLKKDIIIVQYPEDVEKEFYIIRKEISNIKVILLMINMKEKEITFMKMVNVILVNLKMI